MLFHVNCLFFQALSMGWFFESATRYKLSGKSFEELCDYNAQVAEELQRDQVELTQPFFLPLLPSLNSTIFCPCTPHLPIPLLRLLLPSLHPSLFLHCLFGIIETTILMSVELHVNFYICFLSVLYCTGEKFQLDSRP